MPKHRQTEEHRRREPSLKRIRQPWHLEELEAAAQTDVDAGGDEDARRPMDDEAHRGIAFGTSSGGMTGRDSDAGLSVDPEDLGRHFLRDATEQDNFESEFNAEPPTVPDGLPIAQVVSDDTLLSAGQEGVELQENPGLDPGRETDQDERYARKVDLLSNVIHEASLFDKPNEQDEMLSPDVDSDEVEHSPRNPEARAREQERERRLLRRLRFVPSAARRPSRH